MGILAAAVAQAQQVVLRDAGRVVLGGELLGYDGRFYRVLGPFGEVTVDGADLSCQGAACPGPDWTPIIRISGEAAILDTILPPLFETYAVRRDLDLASEAAEEGRVFRLSRDGALVATLVLQPTTSAEGIADIIADAADLIVSLRPPTPLEVDLAEAAGRGTLTAPGRSAILGLDALVPIVSVANPVTQIEMADLARVLSGQITNWAALGGPDAPIDVHLFAPRSGPAEAAAQRLSLGENRAAERHDDGAALAARVAGDPLAIGLTLASALGEAQPLRLTGPCGAATEPQPFAIKTGDYALTLPVFLLAPARRLDATTRDLVDYMTSPLAQPVIRRAGLIDQFPLALPFESQGLRLGRGILATDGGATISTLRRLVRDLAGAARLSLSFRFEEGSTTLDAQSTANVALLAEAVERGVFAGREIVFAGFSDGLGLAARNRILSRQRAQAVRDAVAERLGTGAPPASSVGAYGEALPIACDDAGWGREINRRVEVWLR